MSTSTCPPGVPASSAPVMQRQHEPMARRLDLLGRSEAGAGERAVVAGVGVQLGIDGQDAGTSTAQPVGERSGSRGHGRRWVAGRDRTAWRVGHDARQRPPGMGQDQGGTSIVEAHEGWPPALAAAMLGPGRTLEQVPTGRVDGQGIPARDAALSTSVTRLTRRPRPAGPRSRPATSAPWPRAGGGRHQRRDGRTD